MTLLSDRIEEILTSCYGGNQSAMAKDLGITRSAVSQWKSGGGMAVHMPYKISDKTGYNPRWIATGELPKKIDPIEAQLVLLFRGCLPGAKDDLLHFAERLFIAHNPGKSVANPFPGVSLAKEK